MKRKLIQIMLVLVAYCSRGQGFIYDQQVNNINSPSGFSNIVPDPSGQSFVPSLTSVGFVQFYLRDEFFNDSVGATIYVNLLSGSITNGTLLGTTVPVSLPDNFVGATNFIFSSLISVTPGTTYYLQPVIQSGEDFPIGILSGSSYSSGTAFFQGIAQPGSDLWFREGVLAVPEPSAISLILLGLTGFYFRSRRSY